jgi:hypothetical protein
MRTTLDIDDDVLLAAKDLAQRRRASAGAIISELARQALMGKALVSGVAEPTARYGFRPKPADGKTVTTVEVQRLIDELGEG